MIRMHRYPDDITGLAAFCDTCGEQITDGDGWIVWNEDDLSGWRIVHQARCDPGSQGGYGSSMALDVEIIYLANSAGVDVKKASLRASTLNMI